MKKATKKLKLRFGGMISTLIMGLLFSIIAEYIALGLNLWSYSDLMPNISFGNIEVIPILQILILPLMAFKFTQIKINYSANLQKSKS